MKPLAIDLFCGLGGWTEGLLAEGYDVIGFDIEAHVYGEHRYPAQLVVQDVLTLHGSQFKDATLIVASPPCQEFSYMAMPWRRAKRIAAALRGKGEFPSDYTGSRTVADLTKLFDASFRIQREACEAAGRSIPLLVENVRGAIPWVGQSRWNFGSYHLWGDVPALMPQTVAAHKVPNFRFVGSGRSFQTASVNETGRKSQGMNWSDQSRRGQDFTRIAGAQALAGQKTSGHLNIRDGHSGTPHLTNQAEHENGSKGNWLKKPGPDGKRPCTGQRATWSGTMARKQASAMIAKIPLPLSRHVARSFRQNPAGNEQEESTACSGGVGTGDAPSVPTKIRGDA